MDEKIAVIGMGYVGIPVAALLADAGYDVTGIQRRSQRSGWKIEWLNEGRCPIGGHEPELPEIIKRVVGRGKFKVTDDYAVLRDTEVIFIDVQTPTGADHQPLYRDLEEACQTVGRHLSPGKLVIIESTIAPGTTQYLIKPILEQESGLKAGLPAGFGLCFSYERVMLGRLIHNLREYPKIVGGIDDLSTKRAMSIYQAIVKGGIYGTDPLTAEVAKTVENAYRDVQIAFANEVALLCESLGVDVYDVRRFVNGLPYDPSVPGANPIRNMHLPGAGVGGHCLPKDTWLLFYGFDRYAELKPAYPSSVLKDARILNDWMPVHMADLLEDGLKEAGKSITGARIGILGYAFLENTDDSRNTPSIPLIRELEKRGAQCTIHDPFVSRDESYPIENDLDRALLDCDAIAVVTGHDLYKALDVNKLKKLLKTRVIVDGRNVLDAGRLVAEGFIFRGVGKGNLQKRIAGVRR